MSDVIIYDRMQERRGTAANLASVNEVLRDGEICVETDTAWPVGGGRKFKIGDGVTPWNSLPYAVPDSAGPRPGAIGCTFDAGSGVLEVGASVDVFVPFDCQIVSAVLLADQVGSLEISVWADAIGNFPPTITDNIAAGAPPSIASASNSIDTTLAGWTTAIAAGTTVRFGVVSCVSIRRATLTLEVTRE